jgi:hypothetical protein
MGIQLNIRLTESRNHGMPLSQMSPVHAAARRLGGILGLKAERRGESLTLFLPSRIVA